MYPVKLKFALSTFLLIFFYFPKSINGHIESGTYDVKNSCTKHDKFDRKIFFGPQFRERETRMVNVRNRVGSEKLVNNRRIVDSDSRISDDLQSRNFDFPRLSRNSQDERTNIISRARIIPRLTRDVFETIQTRRDIHARASRTERESRNRIETGNTRRALVDNLDRESRTGRIVDARESRLRESREIRLSTDNVRDFERRDVRTDQASRISRLFNNRGINRDARTESRVARLGIDSNSREQPGDERRERRSLDGSTREVNRRLPEKESREREARTRANNQRRIVDRDSRVSTVESRLIIDNRRLTERVERTSQRRASREVNSRDSQIRSVESQTTRLTERVERSSPDRRNSREVNRRLSERNSHQRDTRTSPSNDRDSRAQTIDSRVTSQNTMLRERVERRRNSERASREVNRRLSHQRDTRTSPTNDRDSRVQTIDSRVTSQNTILSGRVERRRNSERASREVNRRLSRQRETRTSPTNDRDSRVQTIDSRATSQNTRLTERVERRPNSERSSRDVNRRLSERNSYQRDTRTSPTNDRDSRVQTIESRGPSQKAMFNERRGNSERASEENSRMRQIRTTDTNGSRARNIRITENRDSRIRSNEPSQIREREISTVRSYGANNQRVGDGNSRIVAQERSPVRLVESRRTTQNLREWSSPDRRQRHTGTERRDTTRDSREGRTGPTERRVSTADENRNIRIREDRRIVSKREMKMSGARTGEQERRNIRRGERRISDNGRRDTRLSSEHPVDINNNRRITDQQTLADSSRERSSGNQPMKSSENYIFKWSNLFTTTFGILLLMQIITSSNTKKYGIPQISSFLPGVKEKLY